MAKKRIFMVWLFFEKGATYKYVKNWKEAILCAKKSLRREDVKSISIDVRKIYA